MRLLTLFSLLLLAHVSFAQVTLEPEETNIILPAAEAEVVVTNVIGNSSNQTKTFTWKREKECIAPSWTTFICDNNTCWSPSVNSKQIEIAAFDTTFIDVHVKPNGFEGAASIRISVFETADSANNNATVLLLFNTCTVGANESLIPANVRLYPNPSSDFFQLSGLPNYVSGGAIVALTGQVLRTFAASNNEKVDVSNLPVGQYEIQLFSTEGQSLGSLPLLKR